MPLHWQLVFMCVTIKPLNPLHTGTQDNNGSIRKHQQSFLSTCGCIASTKVVSESPKIDLKSDRFIPLLLISKCWFLPFFKTLGCLCENCNVSFIFNVSFKAIITTRNRMKKVAVLQLKAIQTSIVTSLYYFYYSPSYNQRIRVSRSVIYIWPPTPSQPPLSIYSVCHLSGFA